MAGEQRKSTGTPAGTATRERNTAPTCKDGHRAKSTEIRPLLQRVISRSIFVETSRRLSVRCPQFGMTTPEAALLNALADHGAEGRERAASILRQLDFPSTAAITAIEEAANQLGTCWLADESSFFEVSMAMARLQAAVLKAGHVAAQMQADPNAASVLVCTSPNEKHTFAATLIDSLFRANGWNSQFFLPDSLEILSEKLADISCDLVCLCLSGPGVDATLTTVIETWAQPDLQPRPFLAIGGDGAPTSGRWQPKDGRVHYGNDICGLMDVARTLVTRDESPARNANNSTASTSTRTPHEG